MVRTAWYAAIAWIAGHAYELVAFCAPLTIYVRSASSDPANWDTAEMQGVQYLLGIAHPTGFPLYTIAGWIFDHVVVISTPAFRSNIFSGICMASAVLGAYLIAREIRAVKGVALVCALWFGVTSVVWLRANHAEVHDLVLALSAFCILALLRWAHAGDRRTLFTAALLFGLALATHPVAIWLGPGIVVALIMRRRSLTRADVVKAAAIVAACLCLYLYLPIRSELVTVFHQDPSAGLAGVDGGVLWNYNDPRTLSGFLAEVTGSQFGAHLAVFEALDPTKAQSDLWNWLTLANDSFGALGILMAFFGLVRLWRIDRTGTVLLLALGLAAVPFSYSYGAEGDTDRYRMLSLLLVAVLMAATSSETRDTPGRWRAFALGAFACVLALLTYESNRGTYAFSGHAGGRHFIDVIAPSIPAGSIVLANWVNGPSLAYGAYVDGTFAGRIVVVDDPDRQAAHYDEWSREHPVYEVAGPGAPIRQSMFRALCKYDDYTVLFKYGRWAAPPTILPPDHVLRLPVCPR